MKYICSNYKWDLQTIRFIRYVIGTIKRDCIFIPIPVIYNVETQIYNERPCNWNIWFCVGYILTAAEGNKWQRESVSYRSAPERVHFVIVL